MYPYLINHQKQTQDEHHLKLIIDHLEITAGMKILDLGTGSGYLAFAMARNNLQTVIWALL